MPNGLRNWYYKDVVSFLEQHFFIFSHVKSSHYYYRGYVDKKDRLSWFPKHRNSLPMKTLECAIHKSGIPKSYWKKWANSANKKEVQYEGAEDWLNL